GTELGRGRSLKDITTSMPHTAEGITTSLAALGLGKKYDVEMPVADLLSQMLYEGLSPKQAVAKLIKPPVEQDVVPIEKSSKVVVPVIEPQKKWRGVPLGRFVPQPAAGGL
ncbi:MAG: hypothetical protein SVY53_13150, partial [Chloroflexota bacterium]|nr:hypothetical protein [Chloroflexota bacterium]